MPQAFERLVRRHATADDDGYASYLGRSADDWRQQAAVFDALDMQAAADQALVIARTLQAIDDDG